MAVSETTFEVGDRHNHGDMMELFQTTADGRTQLRPVPILYLEIESAYVDEDGREQYRVGHYGPLGRRKKVVTLELEDLEEFGFDPTDDSVVEMVDQARGVA